MPNPLRLAESLIFAAAFCTSTFAAGAQSPGGGTVLKPAEPSIREVSLEECLEAALENNHRRPASRFAVAVAEAQHRQALAAYWPQLSAGAGYQRLDASPNFLFPASSLTVPAQGLALPPGLGLAIADPANNIVGRVTAFPSQTVPVPAQEVTLANPDNALATLDAAWLVFDGGLRKGQRDQTRALVDMMKQAARRTDLEIVDSVKRHYYGSVLARQVHQLGKETLARMEATLSLTETLYQEGGGTVKKTDFLDTKVVVETLRSMVAMLEKSEAMAEAALANSMGLPWKASARPKDTSIPYTPFAEDLENLVSAAYEWSPDWARFDAGLRAAEASIGTAKSGYSPRLALTGSLRKWWNSYDAGLATKRNKAGWSVGVGIEVPLFNGLLTQNRVAEARARVAGLKEQRFLLEEGIALEIKDAVLGLVAADKSHGATLEAMQAAAENRDLTTRAYQNELVETEKVIRAQMMEALMSAQHFRVRFEHVALQSRIDLLVGSEVSKKADLR